MKSEEHKQYLSKLFDTADDYIRKIEKGIGNKKEYAKIMTSLRHTAEQIYNVLIYYVSKKVEKEIKKGVIQIHRLSKDFKKLDNSFLAKEIRKEFDKFKKIL